MVFRRYPISWIFLAMIVLSYLLCRGPGPETAMPIRLGLFVVGVLGLVICQHLTLKAKARESHRQPDINHEPSATNRDAAMIWYDLTNKYHTQTFPHDARLDSFPLDWQRELAALWRLEADVNNGAYLQFLSNWGRETYVYASQALKKIGALRMAEIVDRCQALVDVHFNCEGKSSDELGALMPNEVRNAQNQIMKDAGSILPEAVLARIYELSNEFMSYPDDVTSLGLRHYGSYVANED